MGAWKDGFAVRRRLVRRDSLAPAVSTLSPVGPVFAVDESSQVANSLSQLSIEDRGNIGVSAVSTNCGPLSTRPALDYGITAQDGGRSGATTLSEIARRLKSAASGLAFEVLVKVGSRCTSLIFAACLLCIANAPAAIPTEYDVKAAYLTKFPLFIDWPPTAFASDDSTFNICVVGNDPFDGSLDSVVQGRAIGHRQIAVRRLKVAVPDSGCHVLFVGGSGAQSVSQAIENVRGTSVLTVTDVIGNGRTGAVIQFVTINKFVRFEIDNKAALDNGLTIGAKLLSLSVSPKPQR